MKKMFLSLISLSIVALTVTSFVIITKANSVKAGAENLPKLEIRPLSKTGSSGNLANVNVVTPLPNLPTELAVYKVKKPDLTGEQVKQQALKLGITNGTVKESPIDFKVLTPEGDYIVDKETGSFSYLIKDFELQTEPLKTILSDEEYKKLATDFLNNKGLMKTEAIFKDVNKGNTVTVLENGLEKHYPFMIEVRFGRDLNNLQWDGVGPKISVYLGENGKIIGAASVWREVEVANKYPIISVALALEQIKSNDAIIYDAGANDTGTIKEIKLMYMSDPIGYDQQNVIPYYMMVGTNEAGKPFAAFTRAISKSYLSEIPLPPVEAPIPRRSTK
ncbi:MAG: hypothetical protein RO469_09685 [Thermincola sp.]|jgi:hypothetical protein|nr:hypothetical protein [Thermincola sp.]MDT3702144.1 hypothetical protein [Thermincola sp.]